MANGWLLRLRPDHEYTTALQNELEAANGRVMELQRSVAEAEKLVHNAESEKQRYHALWFYSIL